MGRKDRFGGMLCGALWLGLLPTHAAAASRAFLARHAYADGSACHPGASLQEGELSTELEEGSEERESSGIPLVEVRPGFEAEQPDHVYWKLLSDSPVRATSRVELGSEFLVARCVPPGRWVHLGKGTVLRANGQLVEGRLESAPAQPARGSAVASLPRTGNLHLQAMAGDRILPLRPEPVAAVEISAVRQLAWAEVFESDGNGGLGLNLSQEGRRRIAAELAHFQNAQGRLLVEAFSNRSGTRKRLRAESLERARIVAAHLQSAFGFAPESVVAVGLGADLLQAGVVKAPTWPQREVVDGIALRTVPER